MRATPQCRTPYRRYRYDPRSRSPATASYGKATHSRSHQYQLCRPGGGGGHRVTRTPASRISIQQRGRWYRLEQMRTGPAMPRSKAAQARAEDSVSVPVSSSVICPGGTPHSINIPAITRASDGAWRPMAPVGM